jgi:Zn-dependent M16 (insulinase) family peptidase
MSSPRERCGFELLREQAIPEIASHAQLYRHVRTGAELLALANEDPNKTFGIALRTVPTNDTGVAHVLEHCVLNGGSLKYPLKELFIELHKGSPATFINAFPVLDKTLYPCASQNLQDLYNLMDVYLDVVFRPRLARHTFEQEGWHYELEDLDAPLVYRGIVFNEVKGGYATADAVLLGEALRALFPDTVYGRHVGGHPRHIPDLTYEQLKAFHAAHYHPSNACFFLYGDLPLGECLRRVGEYLNGFGRTPACAGVALQPPFAAPRVATVPYQPVGGKDAGDQACVTVNWVLAESDDPVRTLALEILRQALVGSPASPLRKALLDTGLGEALAGLPEWLRMASGLSAWFLLRQLVFSTGLKGIAAGNAGRVEPLILRTLEALAEGGLATDTLEAALNTVEFRLRENHPAGFLAGQRGIALLLRALHTWLYGGDPLALLAFEAPLAAVKARWAADPHFFGGLIRTHLLENPHRITLYLRPEPDLWQRQEAEEKERLARARAAMDAAALQVLLENTRTLKRRQEEPNSPQALASLPVLTRQDMDRRCPRIPLQVGEEAQTRVFYHPLPTNGIVYLDLGLDLRTLPQEDLPYAALFGQALLEMGTRTQDSVQLGQRIGRFTGGIAPQVLASEASGGAPGPVWLFLRGKATAGKGSELLSILRDVLLTVNLDNRERFRQLVTEEKARRQAGLLSRGAQTVGRRLHAHWTDAGWADDQLNFTGSLFFLRQLAHKIASDWPAVLARLKAIRAMLVNRNALLANVTLDASAWPRFRPALAAFLSDLPIAPCSRARWKRPVLATHEGFAIPSQVNYVGKGANLFRLGYALHGSALAITRYLNSTWLWNQVRAQGGAYEGFATFDHLSGVFTYLSSHDPHLSRTLERFDGTSEALRRVELDDDELARSITGAIAGMDAGPLPDEQGFTSMARTLCGQEDERRQRLRQELLHTTPAHFKAFADVLDAVRAQGHVVVMAAEERLRAANERRGGKWLTMAGTL